MLEFEALSEENVGDKIVVRMEFFRTHSQNCAQ